MGYIKGRIASPLALEPLLRALAALYPETTHTGDYFENRIAKEEQIASELGMSLKGAPLECLRDAARRLGPQPAFDIRVSDNLLFSGRLSSDSVMLHADRTFTLAETRELRGCLESLGFELETFCG